MNKIPRFDFNKWREEYDTYTFEQHKKINNQLELIAPRQMQFKNEHVSNFIKNIPNAKILEIGGWKGHMADAVLKYNKDIVLWHNYDICSNAIEKNICKDSRYKGIVLEDFAWNLDIFSDYNVCIMSHVVEHIKLEEFEKFIKKIKHIKYIYIDCPLNDPYINVNWKNYNGTHIIQCAWSNITNILKNYNEKIIKNVSIKDWQHVIKPACIRTYILK